mmetsp:Transcript_47521/g.110023  ORF Transcript_47521/g.110023 Transcript_47521/m.110023 type:complete len:247 (+) Transcript_47521:71-811(+)
MWPARLDFPVWPGWPAGPMRLAPRRHPHRSLTQVALLRPPHRAAVQTQRPLLRPQPQAPKPQIQSRLRPCRLPCRLPGGSKPQMQALLLPRHQPRAAAPLMRVSPPWTWESTLSPRLPQVLMPRALAPSLLRLVVCPPPPRFPVISGFAPLLQMAVNLQFLHGGLPLLLLPHSHPNRAAFPLPSAAAPTRWLLLGCCLGPHAGERSPSVWRPPPEAAPFRRGMALHPWVQLRLSDAGASAPPTRAS